MIPCFWSMKLRFRGLVELYRNVHDFEEGVRSKMLDEFSAFIRSIISSNF